MIGKSSIVMQGCEYSDDYYIASPEYHCSICEAVSVFSHTLADPVVGMSPSKGHRVTDIGKWSLSVRSNTSKCSQM